MLKKILFFVILALLSYYANAQSPQFYNLAHLFTKTEAYNHKEVVNIGNATLMVTVTHIEVNSANFTFQDKILEVKKIGKSTYIIETDMGTLILVTRFDKIISARYEVQEGDSLIFKQ